MLSIRFGRLAKGSIGGVGYIIKLGCLGKLNCVFLEQNWSDTFGIGSSRENSVFGSCHSISGGSWGPLAIHCSPTGDDPGSKLYEYPVVISI